MRQQPKRRGPVLLAERAGAPDEKPGQPVVPENHQRRADRSRIEADDKAGEHDGKRRQALVPGERKHGRKSREGAGERHPFAAESKQ